MSSDIVNLVVGAIQGLGVTALFLLALFIGVCVVATVVKFRPTKGTRIVKSLDELVGPPIQFLPPSAPRGTMDVLAGTRR